MQEYDADIQFHFTVYDNGLMKLETDIDDQLDYFDAQERTVIIVNLINDLFEQVFQEVDGLDEEKDEEKYIDILNKNQEIRDALISAILNLHHRYYAKHCNKEQKVLEYSMVIYEVMYDKISKDISNYVYNTAHSTNITTFEPMNGALAFELDAMENLLENGVSKKETKAILNLLLSKQKQVLNQYIDTYEEDE